MVMTLNQLVKQVVRDCILQAYREKVGKADRTATRRALVSSIDMVTTDPVKKDC